jgi:hypothetical protein
MFFHAAGGLGNLDRHLVYSCDASALQCIQPANSTGRDVQQRSPDRAAACAAFARRSSSGKRAGGQHDDRDALLREAEQSFAYRSVRRRFEHHVGRRVINSDVEHT